MRKVILGAVRKSLQTYQIKTSYSAVSVIVMYCRSFRKYLYFKRKIFKKVLPNTFQLRTKVYIFLLSCENKTYYS